MRLERIGRQPYARRLAWWSLIVAVLLATPLHAQERGAILLRIHPDVGDTLYTRFEQQVEMTGSTRLGDADTTLEMHTSMLMLSRVLVQAEDNDGATVLTITDSVSVQSAGGDGAVPSEAARLAMEGKRLHLRITPEGSATLLDPPDELTPDVQAVISQMPATLPKSAVHVGGSWTQVMSIPLAGQAAQDGATILQTTYRLDSLSHDGRIAFISMRGTLSRDSTAAALPHGVRLSSSGNMSGSLRVDRQRGWWTESTAYISVKSTLSPPPGRKGNPVHFVVTIVQRMHSSEDP